MGIPSVMKQDNVNQENCSNSNNVHQTKRKYSIKAIGNDSPTHIDHIIGDFGRYQFYIFLFKILIGVTSALNNLAVSFYAPNDFVSHWCDKSITTPFVGHGHGSFGHAANHPPYQLNDSTPNPNRNDILNHHYLTTNSLQTFLSNDARFEKHHSNNFSLSTPKKLTKECHYRSENNDSLPCKGYSYERGIWLSTIIDEWDLVCSRSWMISMTQSLYMSGFIVSFPVFGYISDRYGRWNSLLIGALFEMSAGFGCAFANSITVFMIFRFLIGFGNAGRTSSSYLIMIEWVGPKWRMAISTFGSLGWVIGYVSLPWLTLYFLNFRHMQFFVGMYEFVFIVWLLFLPESPRWLLTHKRYDEARKVLLVAAKFNNLIQTKPKEAKHIDNYHQSNNIENNLDGKTDGRHFSQNLSECQQLNGLLNKPQVTVISKQDLHIQDDDRQKLTAYTEEEFDIRFSRLIETIESKEFSKNEDKLTIVDLMRWENLRKYLFILFFIWAANSFIYYGIVLRIGGDNLFVAFTISGLLEIPSIFFTIVCLKYLPRWKSNMITFSITGLLCLVQVPLKYYDYSTLMQCCIMLAKLANSCAFTCILYQTMELFPTSIRQTAYSACSLVGRFGSILAPFVKELSEKTNDFVPAMLYAILSIISIVLSYTLPETRGTDLHDTLMEAEKFEGTKTNVDESKDSEPEEA